MPYILRDCAKDQGLLGASENLGVVAYGFSEWQQLYLAAQAPTCYLYGPFCLGGIDALIFVHSRWKAFLLSLRERGVEGVLCVTSDAHEGLRRAIEEIFPGAAWQRCIVHLERNAAACATSRSQRGAIFSILHAVFAERDAVLVRELYHLACDEISRFCPKAAALLEDAESDALAYLDFPYAHHRRLLISPMAVWA